MLHASPPLTIGLPVYNGEKHVGMALDDIVEQTFGDFELVISDNASTDRTSEICREYVARDPRIRYHRNPHNLGIGPNVNRVFELCGTRYFKWISHDDRHSPTFLERCIDVLDHDAEVALSHSETGLVGECGEPLRYDQEMRAYLDSVGNPMTRLDRRRVGEGATPEGRFRDVLRNMNGCFHIYGVFRADMLRKVAWRKNYFGHDKVVLAETVLLGRLNQIDEILFFKRSRKGQTTDYSTREKAQLINPHHYSGNAHMLMLRDYLAAVRRTRLSARQQAHMFWTIAMLVRRPGFLRHVFVPGQDNYLGFGSRRPAA